MKKFRSSHFHASSSYQLSTYLDCILSRAAEVIEIKFYETSDGGYGKYQCIVVYEEREEVK